MARPTTISDEHILSAARKVFLEEGFAAPTAKIARAASVSEGSIFKRFSTKEALFFAALDLDASPSWHRRAEALTHEWRGEEGMVGLFVEILAFFENTMPRMFLMFGSRVGAGGFDPFLGLPESPRDRDVLVLGRLIESQIQAGTVRALDSASAADFIMGTLMFRVMHSVIARRPLPPEARLGIARAAYDLVWRGIGQTP